jgi:hypothetical protein
MSRQCSRPGVVDVCQGLVLWRLQGTIKVPAVGDLTLTRRDKVSRWEAGPKLRADQIRAKEGKEEERRRKEKETVGEATRWRGQANKFCRDCGSYEAIAHGSTDETWAWARASMNVGGGAQSREALMDADSRCAPAVQMVETIRINFRSRASKV